MRDWRCLTEDEVRSMDADALATIQREMEAWVTQAEAQVNRAKEKLALVRQMRNRVSGARQE